MSLQDFLGVVVGALNRLDIPFMLTGSLAGSYHGAPRATQDVDLVVEADLAALLGLAGALQDEGLYVSEEAVREAWETRGQFNTIDPSSGWKADFILRKERVFSAEEFGRRRGLVFLGLELSIVSAEDLVIAKLEWARLGDSERQLRDVAEMLAIQGEALDREQIERWVAEFGLDQVWVRAQALVDGIPEPPN